MKYWKQDVWLARWSQWVDATLNSNPLYIENKSLKPLARLHQPKRDPGQFLTEYSETDRFSKGSIVGSTDYIRWCCIDRLAGRTYQHYNRIV